MIGLIGCGGRTDESAKDGSGLYALRGFQDAWAMVLSVQETGKQGTGSFTGFADANPAQVASSSAWSADDAPVFLSFAH